MKIGDMTTCGLCGGDCHVSAETAKMYGDVHGDHRCPACNGSGRVMNRPLCHKPPCMKYAICNECRMCGQHCECIMPF